MGPGSSYKWGEITPGKPIYFRPFTWVSHNPITGSGGPPCRDDANPPPNTHTRVLWCKFRIPKEAISCGSPTSVYSIWSFFPYLPWFRLCSQMTGPCSLPQFKRGKWWNKDMLLKWTVEFFQPYQKVSRKASLVTRVTPTQRKHTVPIVKVLRFKGVCFYGGFHIARHSTAMKNFFSPPGTLNNHKLVVRGSRHVYSCRKAKNNKKHHLMIFASLTPNFLVRNFGSSMASSNSKRRCFDIVGGSSGTLTCEVV